MGETSGFLMWRVSAEDARGQGLSVAALLTFWAGYFFAMGRFSVWGGMFRTFLASIHYIPDIPLPSKTDRNIFRHCPMSPGVGGGGLWRAALPLWKTTELESRKVSSKPLIGVCRWQRAF